MSKRFVIITTVAIALALTACAKPKTINGVTYQPYGILNSDEHKSPKVEYNLSTGNVILSAIFCETLVVPAILISTQLWEPVGPKTSQEPH